MGQVFFLGKFTPHFNEIVFFSLVILDAFFVFDPATIKCISRRMIFLSLQSTYSTGIIRFSKNNCFRLASFGYST